MDACTVPPCVCACVPCAPLPPANRRSANLEQNGRTTLHPPTTTAQLEPASPNTHHHHRNSHTPSSHHTYLANNTLPPPPTTRRLPADPLPSSIDAECHSFSLLSIPPSNSFNTSSPSPRILPSPTTTYYHAHNIHNYNKHYTPTPCDPRSPGTHGPSLHSALQTSNFKASLHSRAFTSLLHT